MYGSPEGSRTEAAVSGSRVAKSDEKGGGDRKVEELADASETGYRGGGERWPEVDASAGERSLLISVPTSKLKRRTCKSFSANSRGRSGSVISESSSTLRRLGVLGPGDELLASRVSDNVVAAGRELRDLIVDQIQCVVQGFLLLFGAGPDDCIKHLGIDLCCIGVATD